MLLPEAFLFARGSPSLHPEGVPGPWKLFPTLTPRAWTRICGGAPSLTAPLWAPPTTGPAAHHLPLSSAEMVLEAVARAISGSHSFPRSLPRTQEAHLFIKGLFVLLFLSFITGLRGTQPRT